MPPPGTCAPERTRTSGLCARQSSASAISAPCLVRSARLPSGTRPRARRAHVCSLLCRRRQRRAQSVPSPSPAPPSPQPRSPPGLGGSHALPPPPFGTLRAARVIDEPGGPIDRGPPTPTLSTAAGERPARPRRAAPRTPRRARRARIFAPRWARCRACATARRRGGSAPDTDDCTCVRRLRRNARLSHSHHTATSTQRYQPRPRRASHSPPWPRSRAGWGSLPQPVSSHAKRGESAGGEVAGQRRTVHLCLWY